MRPSSSRRGLAAGLLAGVAADAVLGDPRRLHPVAGFGRFAGAVERVTYRDDKAAGAIFTAVTVGAAVAVGTLVERAVPRRWYPAAAAAATWTVVGGRSLSREARTLHDLLSAEDLPAARGRLSHLAGRDATDLDAKEIARAGVESVAENSSDAVVAPLLWGAAFGIPGLLGYRAVNTLDAMVGHRTPRYLRFGWASARLDDAANLVPSRLTAGLTAAAAPLVGGSPREALLTARLDAPKHPSPNSGWPEAAFAGALEVRLGGTNTYASGVEHRAVMGDGRTVEVRDLPRAARLAGAVTVLAAGTAAMASVIKRRAEGS